MNNDIPNVPVSELTPENINSIKNESSEPDKPVHEEKPKDKNQKSHLLLIIVGIILFIGVAVALYFIFRPSSSANGDSSNDTSSETIWAPSEDDDYPGQEFINERRATIDNPDATTNEKLQAQVDVANLYAVTGLYDEAEALLNTINRESLTHRQLFILYSAYAYLYEHSGNETARSEYSALLDQELDTNWGEESSSETTGE